MIQYVQCPYTEGEFGHRHAEIYKPRVARYCSKLPEAGGEAWGRFSSRPPSRPRQDLGLGLLASRSVRPHISVV